MNYAALNYWTAVALGEISYRGSRHCPTCRGLQRRVIDRACVKCGAPRVARKKRVREVEVARGRNEKGTAAFARYAAREAGERLFQSALPCRHGHSGPRYVSSGGCVECVRQRSKALGPRRLPRPEWSWVEEAGFAEGPPTAEELEEKRIRQHKGKPGAIVKRRRK